MIPFALSVFMPLAAFAENPAPRELPDFSMTVVTAASSGTITKSDLLGRVWVANFVFTRCQGPCPLSSARMKRLQSLLSPDIRLVSFTIDPGYDQFPQLSAYARKFKADPSRWSFVTAPDEATMIPLLKDGFGTAFQEDRSQACGYATAHSAKFALVGRDGRVKRLYSVKDPEEFERLRRDAESLRSGGA